MRSLMKVSNYSYQLPSNRDSDELGPSNDSSPPPGSQPVNIAPSRHVNEDQSVSPPTPGENKSKITVPFQGHSQMLYSECDHEKFEAL
jgi:hypothetical protein